MRRLLAGGVMIMAGCAAAPEEAASSYQAVTNESGPSACTPETTCPGAIVLPRSNNCTFLIGFDGSGVYDPAVNTNIGGLYNDLPGPAARSSADGLRSTIVDADTRRAYIEGVPGVAVDGEAAERVARGRFAICEHLIKNVRPCDIVLLGYSRGAFIANQVATVMNELGCPGGGFKHLPIKFLGAFDPVNRLMGAEFESESGRKIAWGFDVPPNVESIAQVYKLPYADPRPIDGIGLTTTLLVGGNTRSFCGRGLTKLDVSPNHPQAKDWDHGEIGHFDLPRHVIQCAMERAGVFPGLPIR